MHLSYRRDVRMTPPCHDTVTRDTCLSTRVLPSALSTRVSTRVSALTTLPAGDDGSQLSSGLTAHRRRTDLVPTIVMPRAVSGAPATPGSRHRSPGMMSVSMSRLNTEDIGARTSGVSSSKELVTSCQHAMFVFYIIALCNA